jgi:hypothetical protein
MPCATLGSVESKARLFRGFAEPSRLLIVEVLREGERTVSEICRETGLTQPSAAPVEFTGEGACWVEMGDGRAAFATGNFFSGPEPRLEMVGPSRLRHWSKVAFEKWWLWPWF